MKTTINIDDELIKKAQELTLIDEKTSLIRKALDCGRLTGSQLSRE